MAQRTHFEGARRKEREGGEGKTKNVLWISRHRMTERQMADLRRIMGGPVRLTVWPDTVEDVADLAPAVREADAVCAVLPIKPLAELLRLAGNRPILLSVSGRRPTGLLDENGDPKFHFVHLRWMQVVKLDLELRTL